MALVNKNILDLPKYFDVDWNNDAMVIKEERKKFLFDYVADGLKGTSNTKNVLC